MHNFQIVNTDTDSISFCKKNGESFTKEEDIFLLKEINRLSPEFMVWDDDGLYDKVIVLKSKNYILYDGKTIKKKGSSLKSSTLEPILKEMLNEFIEALIYDKQKELLAIYHKYVKMVSDIKDIKPWAKKLSLSPTTFKSERKNETKIVDAIKGSEYVSGDRIYVYSTNEDTLKLAEHFDGCYNKDIYYEKIYKTTLRFETILSVKEMFLNFKLKKNKKVLELI